MSQKNPELPKDLMSLLEDNFKAGRPLLEDATLYRGTRRPDQTSSSYSESMMHGSMLPQVAASYTHNWKQETAFIGSYKIDRENTRFFQDYGLEQHIDGKKVPSVSVKEAEKLLEPFVREMANATGRDRGRAEESLEAYIKKNLYESNVPARTLEGTPNRPVDLYMYSGRPDIGIRQAVGMQMKRVGPHNEAQVKAVLFREQRNPVIRNIHKLSANVSALPNTQNLVKTLDVLKDMAQRDFGMKLQAEHGHKPLNRLMDDVAKQPLSVEQERLGRFAKALVEGVQHPNPSVRAQATGIVDSLAKLDPKQATFADIAKISAAAKESGQSNTATKTTEASKTMEATKPPASKGVTMDR